LGKAVFAMNDPFQVKLRQATTLHSEGQAERAALKYSQLLDERPNDADVLHLLGVTEIQLGRALSGLDKIAKSLAINPNQPAATANQGNALMALNRAAEALASYDRALLVLPDYVPAVYGRGNALSALGQWDHALAAFDRAIALNSSFLHPLLGRGGILLKLERFSDALTAHDRVIALSELVTYSLAEYERLALQLACTPHRLAEIRAVLAQRKGSCPLFDTDRFRRHLEAAYLAMHERHRQGHAPATFKVSPQTR
jgi:tetratricopeptide (TPR) repeat protein